MKPQEKDIESLAKQQFILGMVYASVSIKNELSNKNVPLINRVKKALELCDKYSHPNLKNLSSTDKEQNIETNKQ